MDKLTESNRMIFKQWQMNLKETRLKIAGAMISKHKGKLLDVACSKGEFSKGFLIKNMKVYGFDLNIDKSKIAKKDGLKVVVAQASGVFPFKDRQFDIIFAGEILEHIVDTDLFIKEMRRVLKPSGKLILTTPNLVSFENRMRALLGRYPIWLDYKLGLSGHVRGFTPKVLKHLLALHGFRTIRYTGNWVPFIPQKYIDDIKCPFLALTGKLLPNLAMDIIIEAEKYE